LNNPPQGSQAKARPNGDILLYDPKTNTFGAYDKFGTPKSMFRPTAGIAYFLAQAGKVIAPLVIILSPTPVE
jgi:filamentous hemagglutinin